MNRTRAIKEHCFDCAGENDKEVGLCCLFDCPLWQYRTGHDLKSKTYQNRMLRYKTSCAEDLERMRRTGLDISRFFEFGEIRKARGGVSLYLKRKKK